MKAPNGRFSVGAFYSLLIKMNGLHYAWRHVRASTNSSGNAKIRELGIEFEESLFSRLKSIQSKLVQQSFVFPLAEGILKDKRKRLLQGKRPRPIVIAPIESRVVQRAILNIVQQDTHGSLYEKLGKINEINSSPYSIGGVPNDLLP